MSPVQLPGSSSTPYWESSLNTIEKSKPWQSFRPLELRISWTSPSTPDSRRCGWAGPRWSRWRCCPHPGRRGRVAPPLNPPSAEVSSGGKHLKKIISSEKSVVHWLSVCDRLERQNCARFVFSDAITFKNHSFYNQWNLKLFTNKNFAFCAGTYEALWGTTPKVVLFAFCWTLHFSIMRHGNDSWLMWSKKLFYLSFLILSISRGQWNHIM